MVYIGVILGIMENTMETAIVHKGSHSASRAGVLMSHLCWVHMIARIQYMLPGFQENREECNIFFDSLALVDTPDQPPTSKCSLLVVL